MCLSAAEGGQRCSAHTAPAYMRARSGADGWDEAAVAFASTPRGREHLEAEVLAAVRAGDYGLAGRLSSAIDRGQAQREANRAVRLALAGARSAAVRRHLTGGYCDMGDEADLRSAQTILTALVNLKASAGYVRDAGKQQREVITKAWQYPRLPRAR